MVMLSQGSRFLPFRIQVGNEIAMLSVEDDGAPTAASSHGDVARSGRAGRHERLDGQAPT